MATRDERLRAALEVRALDGHTSTELEYVEDVDGIPSAVAGGFTQVVVFVPEAFGVTAEEVEAAGLIESAMSGEEHEG